MKSGSRKIFPKFVTAGFIVLFLLTVFSPAVSYGQGTTPIDQAYCDSHNTPGTTAPMNVADAPAVNWRCVTTDQNTIQQLQKAQPSSGLGIIGNFTLSAILSVINVLLIVIESIIAGFLGIAGIGLDAVIKYSITDLAINISKLNGINIAWATIRDLANMSFIFVLLYNGIMTIFTSENKAKKIIVPVIIAALLINFSLFFTKLIIDASNIVALSFYNSVAPENTTNSIDLGVVTVNGGLSIPFMKALNLSGLYDPKILTLDVDQAKINLITVLGGSVFMLIATFVFLAMMVLFIIRYLVFILLLIISPLGYMASVIPGLPGLKSISTKYWDTLIGQALFAPIFMIMIWIVLTLLPDITKINAVVTTTIPNAPATLGTALSNPISGISLVLNYFIVIGLLIMTIVVSKSYATKGGIVTSKMVGAATGFAGGLAFGGMGALGRNTVGRYASNKANDQDLKDRAARGDRIAMAKLATYRYGAKSTFDARQSSAGKGLAGYTGIEVGKGLPFAPKAGEGGFEGRLKAKKEAEKKYAESLAPTEEAEAEAKDKLANDEDFKAQEEKERKKYVAETQADHDTKKAGSQTEVDNATTEKDTAKAEREKLEEENTKLNEEIETLKKRAETEFGDDRVETRKEIDQKTKLKKQKENELETAREIEKEKIQIHKDAQKELLEIDKKRRADIENWISPEKAKLIAISGGQKEERYEKGHALEGQVKTQFVDTGKNLAMDEYANTLETQGTWARAWGKLGGSGVPKLNKQAAAGIRKARKGKSLNDLIAEKAIADKAAADAATGTAATTPTPTAPPPPPPTGGTSKP